MIKLAKDDALEQLALEQERLEAFAGCAMCKLADLSSQRVQIARSRHGIAALDGFAATRGHVLIVARQHVERGVDLDWPVYADLQRLVWEATQAVEHALRPQRVYVAALGSSKQLPMSFPHFHIHVVPVYTSDETARPAHVLSWSSGVIRYQEHEADDLVRQLKAAWPGRSAVPRLASRPGARSPESHPRESDHLP